MVSTLSELSWDSLWDKSHLEVSSLDTHFKPINHISGFFMLFVLDKTKATVKNTDVVIETAIVKFFRFEIVLTYSNIIK